MGETILGSRYEIIRKIGDGGSFKAVSRAIRAAVEIDERRNGSVPSTKGVIA